MSAAQIDYRAVLADLKEKRAKLNAAIAGIETLLSDISSSNGKQLSTPAFDETMPVGLYTGLSMVEAAKKYLRMTNSKQSTTNIMKALEAGGFTHDSKNFQATVYAGLFKNMNNKGEFVRIGNDWGLAEWDDSKKK